MVKVNGETFELDGMSLEEYLDTTNYSLKFIAVERNGKIVPKSDYASERLQDGDELEIVSFVGGG